MGWMRWLLLESFTALALGLFLVNFFLLVYWRRSGRPRPLLIGLAAAAVLLCLQNLVVTRQEHAGRILAGIEREIPTAAVAALAAVLSDDFECDGMDADEFVAFAEAGLERVDVDMIRRIGLEIGESGTAQFVARVVYLSDVRVADLIDRLIKTVWDVTFVQERGRWRIAGVRAVQVGDQQVDDIRELSP